MGCNCSKKGDDDSTDKISNSKTSGDNKLAEGDKKPGQLKVEDTDAGKNKNGFLNNGLSNAKVCPMVEKEDLPKAVAFEIELNGNQEAKSTNGADNLNLKPRKLPTLKPVITKTQEDLINKQKKAEEKRQEILELKKQKARKFLTKSDQKDEDDTKSQEKDAAFLNNQIHDANDEDKTQLTEVVPPEEVVVTDDNK